MSNYIKQCREDAGLTQEKLAEKMQVSVMAIHNWESGKTKVNPDRFNELSRIFNVPVEDLIREMLREEDKTRNDNWPGFLFDEDTNVIVDKLHLNLAQQDLFGLLYIYAPERDECQNHKFFTEFDEKLKKIPYSFVEKTGSIRFINLSEKLKGVLKYVDPNFLMSILKQNPESEFDVKRLPKDQIKEFIDGGVLNLYDCVDDFFDNDEYYEGYLELNINIKKAERFLPVIDKIGPVQLKEEWVSSPIRKVYPVELIEVMLDEYNLDKEEWEKGKYKNKGILHTLAVDLAGVTNLKNIAKKGKKDCWMLTINDRGKELLKWLKE